MQLVVQQREVLDQDTDRSVLLVLFSDGAVHCIFSTQGYFVQPNVPRSTNNGLLLWGQGRGPLVPGLSVVVGVAAEYPRRRKWVVGSAHAGGTLVRG
jgi:hypothetical protein